jgi:hypothetical protein
VKTKKKKDFQKSRNRTKLVEGSILSTSSGDIELFLVEIKGGSQTTGQVKSSIRIVSLIALILLASLSTFSSLPHLSLILTAYSSGFSSLAHRVRLQLSRNHTHPHHCHITLIPYLIPLLHRTLCRHPSTYALVTP